MIATEGAAQAVLAYHRRTKHHLDRYAAGPETLDWDAQPNPFREFAGSPRIPLPLLVQDPALSFADLPAAPSLPCTVDAVAHLLELSLALAAWKQYGPDRWALRCNPSSGNLHPTEGYVLAFGVRGLEDGVYHYLSREHVLEQRWRPDEATAGRGLFLALSSIHWREAWKYGERAFRYCQLDVGHALGALRYAAACLGWSLRLREDLDNARLAALLGLDRVGDFAGAEREEADLLVEVTLPGSAGEGTADPIFAPGPGSWAGQANLLDPHPLYRWPVIEEAAAASRPSTLTPDPEPMPVRPPLAHQGEPGAAAVIRGRRSAQHFDPRHGMAAATFFHILDSLLPRPGMPWDCWHFAPRVHPVLFVHRVEGLEPGLYAMPRSPRGETLLRASLNPDFEWQPAIGRPAHLPLYRLQAGDARDAARMLSCHQAIAADGCFSLALLAEFAPLVAAAPWRYRQLHWEAGLVGHVLYLEAEAAGLRGTGIGCFFDDAVHQLLGLGDEALQSLYHFTVGHGLTDTRITTLPPYPGR